MIDFTRIRMNMSIDDVILLMSSIDVDYNFASDTEVHFRSICHNSNSYKLYYYDSSKRFYCFRCGESFDIFEIFKKVLHISLSDAVKKICKQLNINVKNIDECSSLCDNWAELRRFLPNAEPEPDKLFTYDKAILSLFDHLYPQEWLDYGISADTLDKFGIGWYARQACISIPVVFNGQLVGVRGRYTREQDVAKGKYRPICTLDGTVLKFPSSACLYGYDQNKVAIEKSHQVVLFESEKSVLKAPSYNLHNALAVFGSNISKQHIQLLLELGVNDVVIAFDSDYKQIGDDEFKFFVVKMKKLAAKLKPFFNCSIVYNNQGYNMYKCNMMDIPYKQAMKLWESRVRV